MSFFLERTHGCTLMPEDVMIHVLSRLPVKSLMRLRVCRSWYDLVLNPTFISKHIKNYNDINFHLIISYEVIADHGREQALTLFHDKTLTNVTYQDLHRPKPGTISGPFDGIFCLCTENRVTLWNLATREYRTLPKCSIVLPRYLTPEYLNAGFGLDPISNDYKLLFLRSFWNEKSNSLCKFSHVAVYTLCTDTWRLLKGNEWIPYHLSGKGIYLNGVFYWLASGEDNYYKEYILSFHMGDEKFQEIETPHIPELASETLGLYDNSLTMLLFHWNDSYFDMWVMKESCWIKQLSFGPILGVLSPLGFWKNGTFFIESLNGHLLLYDPFLQELRDLGRFISGAASAGIRVHSYKESLARIKGDESSFDFNDIPWHILGVHQIDSNSN